MKKNLIAISGLLLFTLNTALAQGDGARSFLLAPKGVTGVNTKWLSLSSNLIPAGTALVPGADIQVDVFPITLFHTFSLGGRIAQAYVTVIPGSAIARAKVGPPIGPIPFNQIKASGLSDGFVGFRVGLKGAPAMDISSFVKAPMQLSVFGDLRLWYSGSYDAQKLFNLGTNRMSVQASLPMAIPLNQNRAHATWLEVSPSMMFFADNNEPARGSGAEKVEQAPLFLLENHLSHNFSSKLWASVNVRVQSGGRTSVDGVKDDNNISVLGLGAGIGYQVIAPMVIAADYGGVVVSDQTKGQMFRLSLVFTYANLKKTAKGS